MLQSRSKIYLVTSIKEILGWIFDFLTLVVKITRRSERMLH